MSGPLGNREIAALIPHADAMCLLDQVRSWDRETIVCTASSHREPGNPLARDGRLETICGVEYAAQAMAVHGGLTSGSAARPTTGYLASIRDVVCHVARLDLLRDDLEITVTLLAGDSAAAMYGFVVRSGNATVLDGRAAVVIDALSAGRAGSA